MKFIAYITYSWEFGESTIKLPLVAIDLANAKLEVRKYIDKNSWENDSLKVDILEYTTIDNSIVQI